MAIFRRKKHPSPEQLTDAQGEQADEPTPTAASSGRAATNLAGSPESAPRWEVVIRPAAKIAIPPDYHAPEVVPGMRAVLRDATDERSEYAHSSEGIHDVRGVWGEVMAHLAQAEAPQVQEQELDGARVYLASAPDAAARLVTPAALVRSVTAEEMPTGGVLVAMPRQEELMLHAVHSSIAVRAVNAMAEELPQDALSPHVYHLAADGRATQVTATTKDGRRAIAIGGTFEEALRGLTE